MPVIINGATFNGSTLNISGGRVIVNGKDVTPTDTKEINITINGNVDELEVDACSKISITGDVGNIKTVIGNVDVKGTVNGSIHTVNGNVNCGPISGNVSTTNGNIQHR